MFATKTRKMPNASQDSQQRFPGDRQMRPEPEPEGPKLTYSFGLSFSMKSALTQYEAQLLEPQEM